MDIVHAFVRFCMVLNPTMCQELEIVPIDHAAASISECAKGVMMGSTMEFDYQGARWEIRGGTCRAVQSSLGEIQARLRDTQE